MWNMNETERARNRQWSAGRHFGHKLGSQEAVYQTLGWPSKRLFELVDLLDLFATNELQDRPEFQHAKGFIEGLGLALEDYVIAESYDGAELRDDAE